VGLAFEPVSTRAAASMRRICSLLCASVNDAIPRDGVGRAPATGHDAGSTGRNLGQGFGAGVTLGTGLGLLGRRCRRAGFMFGGGCRRRAVCASIRAAWRNRSQNNCFVLAAGQIRDAKLRRSAMIRLGKAGAGTSNDFAASVLRPLCTIFGPPRHSATGPYP